MAEHSEGAKIAGGAAGGAGGFLMGFKLGTLIAVPLLGPLAPAVMLPMMVGGAIYGSKKGYKRPGLGAANIALAVTPIPAIVDAADEGLKALDEALGNPKPDVMKYKT